MTLLISPENSTKPVVWFDINPETYFDTYTMLGVSPESEEENKIYYEFSAINMCTALASLKYRTHYCEIKLTKKDFPCLSVNMKILSMDTDKLVDVSNQVPVIIVPRSKWEDYSFPEFIVFDISAKLPRVKVFKKYIETYKNSSKNIQIRLKKDNMMILKAQNEATKLTTQFKEIKMTSFETSDPYDGENISVYLESKKISHWLNSLQFKSRLPLVCHMKHHESFKLHFKIRNDIQGSFVMGAVYDDDEDEPDDPEPDQQNDDTL